MATGSFIPMPTFAILDQACVPLHHLGQNLGIVLVGSALERPDYRDIDLRMIMTDKDFLTLFPTAELTSGAFSLNPTWRFLISSISSHLSYITGGLPIDFQIQPLIHSENYRGLSRQPMGIQITKYREEED